MNVTQSYLYSKGWTKDHTCPDNVNRWQNSRDWKDKEKHNSFAGELWASVTFKDTEGTEVDYAVVNHHTAPYGYIRAHRTSRSIEGGHIRTDEFLNQKTITGVLSVEELNEMMERNN